MTTATQPPSEFAAAHGSPALTWSEEPPKRRGRWWWWPERHAQWGERKPRIVKVKQDALELYALGVEMGACEMSRPVEYLGGRWAGPLSKSDETPPVEPPGNR